MSLRILREQSHPWGDYGHILMHGMCERGTDALLQLERTGPFVPELTFPGSGSIVVSDSLRQDLARTSLKGFTFRPVNLTRAVRLEWQLWDSQAAEPAELPSSGEPEDYVLAGRHDPALAVAMTPLWEIELTNGLTTRRQRRIVEHQREIEVLRDSWSGADICRASGVGYIYVSDDAQAFLAARVPTLVEFEDCTLVDGAT